MNGIFLTVLRRNVFSHHRFLPGGGLFSTPTPPPVPPPPPPPEREDPAIAQARERLRQTERRRRGRRATILTGDQSQLGEGNVARPSAGSSNLLGE